MSPVPKGTLRIDAWIKMARASAMTTELQANSTLKGSSSQIVEFPP